MPVPSHMASWSDSWELKISSKCLKVHEVSLRFQKEHIFVAFVNNRLRRLYVSRTILLIVSIASDFSIDSSDCQRLLLIAPQVNFGSVAAFLELSAMLSIKTSVVLYKIYIDTMASFSSIPPLYRNVWLRHSRDCHPARLASIQTSVVGHLRARDGIRDHCQGFHRPQPWRSQQLSETLNPPK